MPGFIHISALVAVTVGVGAAAPAATVRIFREGVRR
jgi:hypothetical protein